MGKEAEKWYKGSYAGRYSALFSCKRCGFTLEVTAFDKNLSQSKLNMETRTCTVDYIPKICPQCGFDGKEDKKTS